MPSPIPMASKQCDPEQLLQIKEIFDRFDMDKDGSLTLLELAALLRSLGIKPTGDQIHTISAGMDANGNGSIEFDELVETMLSEVNEQVICNQDQLMALFKDFDRDGNGVISAAELAGKMAKMGQPITFSELTEIMQDADIDGDGAIGFNEFARIMARSAVDNLSLPPSWLES